MSKEERYENRQWNDAVRDYKRAYNQFSDFAWKVEIAEPERAAKHLRKAQNDFSSAMTHVAKADVGEANSGAVDAVNKGIDELGRAVTDLDNGNIDSAEGQYDKAAANFDKAAAIMG